MVAELMPGKSCFLLRSRWLHVPIGLQISSTAAIGTASVIGKILYFDLLSYR